MLKDVSWDKVKRLCQLDDREVEMAKEMMLDPRILLKNRPNKKESWKLHPGHYLRRKYDKWQEEHHRPSPNQPKV